jgi:hypothetical protein
MLKSLAVGALILSSLSQASAAQISSRNVSCASLKEAVSSAGAALVSYQSNQVAGLRLYDRFVRDSRFCQGDEVTETKFVPASDTPNCALPRCVPTDCDDAGRR